MGGIWRVDPDTGLAVEHLVRTGSGGLRLGTAATFGPDGNLYVGDDDNAQPTIGSILRYDGRTGAPLPAPGRDGALFADEGLIAPRALAFGPDGNLFVAQGAEVRPEEEGPTDAILRFDGVTGARVGTQADGTFVPDDDARSGGLDEPLDLAFGPDGHLYVASWRTSSVLRYDRGTGAFLGVFVPAGRGGLALPKCLAFNSIPPPATSTTTTTTLPAPSTTTTTLAAPVCGDGVRNGSEECDPASTTADCGPERLCDGCRCVPRELCGNCVDDNGNGRTDFEDPACCTGAQSLGMTITGASLRPATLATRLSLKSTVAGAGALALGRQDLFVQLRRDGGEQLLCARIPADRLVLKRKKYQFTDKAHAVPGAASLDKIVVALSQVGSAAVSVTARKAALRTPAAGSLRVTLGFRDPTAAEAGNRCAAAVQPFRTGKKGAIQFP
jgi:hypothetical protein